MKNLYIALIMILTVSLSGCLTTANLAKGDNLADKKVTVGDEISVNYIGTFDDGTVFDTSIEDVAKDADIFNEQRKYEPLTFEVGAGQMIKGFDEAVVGMRKGETKKVRIEAKDAYGAHDPDLVKKVPLEAFKQSGVPPVGATVSFTNGLHGTVLKINEDTITVDFNDRMAGKDLNFEITLVDIR